MTKVNSSIWVWPFFLVGTPFAWWYFFKFCSISRINRDWAWNSITINLPGEMSGTKSVLTGNGMTLGPNATVLRSMASTNSRI